MRLAGQGRGICARRCADSDKPGLDPVALAGLGADGMQPPCGGRPAGLGVGGVLGAARRALQEQRDDGAGGQLPRLRPAGGPRRHPDSDFEPEWEVSDDGEAVWPEPR